MDLKHDDHHLLKGIAKGSESSFHQFYDTYISFVLNIATQVLGDRNEAEDMTHDIFLEVFQKPHEYNPDRGSVKAWLAVKTKNRCIDRLRKSKPVLVQKLELIDTRQAVETERTVLQQIERELIMDALKHLPKKQREIIYGAYFEEQTQKELAKTYKHPLGTVKSLVRYGLRNLQKHKPLMNWIKISKE